VSLSRAGVVVVAVVGITLACYRSVSMVLAMLSAAPAAGPCLLEALETYAGIEGISIPMDTVGPLHFTVADHHGAGGTLEQSATSDGFRLRIVLALPAPDFETLRPEDDSLVEVTGRSILRRVGQHCLGQSDSIRIRCGYPADSTRPCPSDRVPAT
jgi:hypothetical protein